MELLEDSTIYPLYRLARGGGSELMIDDIQREAIRTLGDLARNGSRDAKVALAQLCRQPGYHPLLREMASASL